MRRREFIGLSAARRRCRSPRERNSRARVYRIGFLRVGEPPIPGTASATVDGRFLYGQQEEFERQLAGLIGEGIQREWLVHDQAVETTFDGPLVDQMVAALKAEDDGARPVPFTMSGGTDAKSFERLGHALLRVLPAATAAGPRLRLALPRHRRAGAGGVAEVRRPGAGPLPQERLTPLLDGMV